MSQQNGPAVGGRFNPAAICVRVAERWMPDAFVIAIALTALTIALAVGVARYPVGETIAAWGDGFWNLLAFTNQIVLTLLFGYALAHTAPMVRALSWIAGRARTAGQAYLLVGFISCVASVFSWALCLVAGAIMARRTAAACAARGVRVHYPLLVATGFSGIAIWHQGLSSSIGLSIATPGHPYEGLIGLIPTSQTVFAPWNLAILLAIAVTLPFVMRLLAPKDRDAKAFVQAETAQTANTPDVALPPGSAPAEHLENSRIVAALAVAAGGYYVFTHFFARGGGLDLNTLNFCFLVLGIALAGRPSRYISLIADAAKVCAPFLLQYPFYAGIAAIMAQSGLAALIVNWFVGFSTPDNLPLFTFLSAGVLNIFIPSGGGQWAVQGPIAMSAALEIGADLPKTAMAVAMGDQWTNLIQPLVALPALAVAGLHIRDIMGYCLMALAYTGLIFVAALMLI